MTLSRLYVARDAKVTAISPGRMRMADARPVRRNWRALVEVTARALEPKPLRSLSDAVLVVLPPVLAGSFTAAVAPLEAGIAVGGAVFFAASYLAPVLRRRAGQLSPFGRAGQDARFGGAGHNSRGGLGRRPGSGRAEVRLLTAPAERAAFQQATDVADRIADTWPALGTLVDPSDAEPMLAEALWEISGLLARRQELTALLADLSRPDFAAIPVADQTARDLRTQVRATKAALTQVEADLARRQASLRRAEEAGRHFIREQEMRQAIQAAEHCLRDTSADGFPAASADPAADLADQTRMVLQAYRELTAGLHTNPPAA